MKIISSLSRLDVDRRRRRRSAARGYLIRFGFRALSVSVLLLEPSCREDAVVAGRAAPAGLARAHPVGHVSRELVAYLTTTVPPGL